MSERINWGTRLEIPVRLITLPVDGATLDEHAESIQRASLESVETSMGALSMLAQIAGRRIPASIRAVIPEAISEILEGRLDTDSGETQDLLAPTIGEIFGSLLFILENGRDADVIRVIEDAQRRSPDYLVIEASRGGLALSVLECKSTATDYYTAQQRGQLDICSQMWRRRRDGLKQLEMPDPSQLGSGLSFRSSSLSGSLLNENKCAVAVTCVPDGRLTAHPANIKPPDRRVCQQTNCIECSMGRNDAANLLVCLSNAQLATDQIGQELRAFLEAYRSCEQALWSHSERHFAEAYRRLLNSTPALGFDSINRLSSFLLEPLAAAIALRLPVRLMDLPISDLPDSIRRAVSSLREQSSDEPSRSEMPIHELPSLYPRWSDGQEELPETVMLLEDRIGGLELHGTIQDRGSGVLDIRICPSSSELGTSYEDNPQVQTMQVAARNIVNEIRQGSARQFESRVSLVWSRAWVRFRDRSFIVGDYWNRFPYPLWRRGLPGFTTWVGWDGRARIICRLPGGR